MTATFASRFRVAFSFLALAAAALLLWRCAASTERPAATTDSTANALPSAVISPGEPAGAAPAASLPQPASPVAVEPASPSGATPSTTAGAPATGASAIVAAVGRRDPRDLALLARIERELKRDPPESVHALVRLHEAGASRSELLSRVSQLPAGDVGLRVLVLRWIDEVAPDPNAPRPPLNPVPSGSHRPLVKPIERSGP